MQNNQAVIIKKVKKGGHGGHHGGAWKVAYADFVTAMMAFFLLLWLLNVTTDVQKKGIADYFTPASVSRTESGSGGILGGRTLISEGSKISDKGVPSAIVAITPPAPPNTDSGDAGDQDLDKKLAEREQQKFEETKDAIRQAIQDAPELAALQKQLLIDMTPEGLRIQLVDQEQKSMFPSGSAQMNDQTRLLLQKISQVVSKLPNKLSITGHTDATPFRTQNGYGNWELSSDRANASRRALIDAGVDPHRITQVIGKADQDPLLPADINNASNRRISIVLLRDKPATPEAPVLPPDQRSKSGPR